MFTRSVFTVLNETKPNSYFFTVVLWKINFKCLVPTCVSGSSQEINIVGSFSFKVNCFLLKPTKHANIISLPMSVVCYYKWITETSETLAQNVMRFFNIVVWAPDFYWWKFTKRCPSYFMSSGKLCMFSSRIVKMMTYVATLQISCFNKKLFYKCHDILYTNMHLHIFLKNWGEEY